MYNRCIILLAMLLSASAAAAQGLPCSSNVSVRDYIQDLAAAGSAELTAAGSEEVAARGTLEELAERVTGDGISEGRLDVLRKVFVALDLGKIQEEDDAVVFNFNSGQLGAVGKLSPRLVVHQPTVYASLVKHLDGLADQAAAATTKKELEDGLSDVDDVELRLRWTPAPETPERRVEKLTPWARELFDDALQTGVAEQLAQLGEEAAAANGALKESLRSEGAARPEVAVNASDPLLTPINEVCRLPRTAKLARETAERLRALTDPLHTLLRNALTAKNFFDLADLLEGASTLVAEASLRQRDGAAGPDERSFTLRFEKGNTSIRGFERWAQLNKRQLADGRIASSLAEYLAGKMQSLPKLSIKVDYVQTEDFAIAVPRFAGLRGRLRPEAHGHRARQWLLRRLAQEPMGARGILRRRQR